MNSLPIIRLIKNILIFLFLAVLVWLVAIYVLKINGRDYDVDSVIRGIEVSGEVKFDEGFELVPGSLVISWQNFDNKILTATNQVSSFAFDIPNGNLLTKVKFDLSLQVISQKTGNEFVLNREISKLAYSRKINLGDIIFAVPEDYGYLVSVFTELGGQAEELPRQGKIFYGKIGDIVSFETLWLNTDDPLSSPYENVEKHIILSGDPVLSKTEFAYEIIQAGKAKATVYCTYVKDGQTLSLGEPVEVEIEVK